MPLSEEELRMLEQMERALLEEDPKLASTLRGARVRSSARRRLIASIAVFVVGVALMMTGVVTTYWALGIAGFLVMLGSATVGLSSLRAANQVPPSAEETEFEGLTLLEGGQRPPRRARRQRSGGGGGGSFMSRMEDRWRRRRDQGGY